MENPFIHPIIIRLENIESTLKKLFNILARDKVRIEPNIVDLKGLLKYRPIIGTKKTVYKLVHERRLPFYKPRGSKSLYFRLDEIDSYLLGEKTKSTKELIRETDQHLANRA